MRYKKHIYSLLLILLAMCITGALFSFYYSHKYAQMSENAQYIEISRKIQNIHELEKLRAIALQLHQNTIDDAVDNSKTIQNYYEVLLSLSTLLLLVLYFYYRDNVSNNSSNLTGAKDAPPS